MTSRTVITCFLSASLFLPTISTPVFAGNLIINNCSNKEKTYIKKAHAWLKNNIRSIDGQMGRKGLMNWPGKSRNKFIQKLKKRMKVVCINEKRKCQKVKKNGKIG